MCLYVDTIPEEPRMGMLVPAFKFLNSNMRTPSIGTRVPKDGLLLPSAKSVRLGYKIGWWEKPRLCMIKSTELIDQSLSVPHNTDLNWDCTIHGGCIHSYWRNCDQEWYKCIQFCAFAFRVFAYGSHGNGDMVSLALYIPAADKTANRPLIEKEIERILNLPRWPRNSDFKKLSTLIPIGHLFPSKRENSK